MVNPQPTSKKSGSERHVHHLTFGSRCVASLLGINDGETITAVLAYGSAETAPQNNPDVDRWFQEAVNQVFREPLPGVLNIYEAGQLFSQHFFTPHMGGEDNQKPNTQN